MQTRLVSDSELESFFKSGDWELCADFIYQDLAPLRRDEILFVPQGGAWSGSEPGIRRLAVELEAQIGALRHQGKLQYPDKRPIIFLGAGTGTTALYLARHLAHGARVVAVPVAGSSEYLIRQMRDLELRSGRSQLSSAPSEFSGFPEVLRPRMKASFADIRREKLLVWKELERAGKGLIHFDLVYGPPAWEEVWLALDERRLDGNRDLIFLHTGGLEGNDSMLSRFVHKGLLSDQELSRLTA
jgi:1-aminocyclopropane-1-carboxylate deaminase/D-cysteine desulfhydrase-like pyridoxal-dependent ACC family enzyme